MSDYDPNYIHTKVFALVGQKAIILNQQNQVLVLQRSDKAGAGGKWSLAGGSLEEGEEPFEGIRREIREETELEVTDLKPYTVHSTTSDDNDFVVIIGYSCIARSEDVVLNWEHDAYRWLTKEEAFQLDLTESARFFIEQFTAKSW